MVSRFQSIVTPDGLISSISGPIIGSRGDWILWRQSNIEDELRRIFEEAGVSEESRPFLYGDPAYGNHMQSCLHSNAHPVDS